MNDYERIKKDFTSMKIKIQEMNTLEQKIITIYQSNSWAPTGKCSFYFDKETGVFLSVDIEDM
jgi:hypothetical protein